MAPATSTPNPLYPSSSSYKPQLLSIDFTEDPTGSLGAQLVNFDKVCVVERWLKQVLLISITFHSLRF